MSTRDPGKLPTTGPDGAALDRYRLVGTGEGVILYDQQRERAWIQASAAVALEEWR